MAHSRLKQNRTRTTSVWLTLGLSTCISLGTACSAPEAPTEEKRLIAGDPSQTPLENAQEFLLASAELVAALQAGRQNGTLPALQYLANIVGENGIFVRETQQRIAVHVANRTNIANVNLGTVIPRLQKARNFTADARKEIDKRRKENGLGDPFETRSSEPCYDISLTTPWGGKYEATSTHDDMATYQSTFASMCGEELKAKAAEMDHILRKFWYENIFSRPNFLKNETVLRSLPLTVAQAQRDAAGNEVILNNAQLKAVNELSNLEAIVQNILLALDKDTVGAARVLNGGVSLASVSNREQVGHWNTAWSHYLELSDRLRGDEVPCEYVDLDITATFEPPEELDPAAQEDPTTRLDAAALAAREEEKTAYDACIARAQLPGGNFVAKHAPAIPEFSPCLIQSADAANDARTCNLTADNFSEAELAAFSSGTPPKPRGAEHWPESRD